MRFLKPLSVLLLPAAMQAVDIQAPSPPAYLAIAFRAEWRMKPLSEVLDEIQKAIDRPISASPSAKELLGRRRVTMLDVRSSPLTETLERLESMQELRFAAEPLRLRLETAADALARRRRPVDLDLVEYGISTVYRDFPGPSIGLCQPSGGAQPLPAGDGAANDHADTVEGALEWIARIAETGGMEQRGRTALQILATPEEEQALRATLAECLELKIRRSAWRICWGVAKPGITVPTGLVPVAEATRMEQGLEQRTSEVLHAMAGQRVHGGRLQERSYIADLDIVSDMQDPAVAVLRTGRMANIRPLPGDSQASLAYRLDWCDPIALTDVAITQGSLTDPGPAATPSREEAPSAPMPPAAAIPGSQATLQLPSVWNWSPRGDVMLPHGYALVLCAEHPLGHAVISIHEVR